jgi:aldehyde dehydrogenase (NAD+)
MMNATGNDAPASSLSEYGLQSSGVRRFTKHRGKPTVLADGQNSVAIVREKIFVPEFAIIPYEHEDEAVRCARHPGDLKRTQGFEANSIRQGSHRWLTPDRGSRFGEYKQSGNGRQ